MGIFDIFKKNIGEEVEQPTIKLTFDKLNSMVHEELKEVDIKILDIKGEINYLVTLFSSEIREKLPVLREINLEKRKEREELKEIVLQNLAFYISHLEKLVGDLERIREEDVKEYINHVQLVFNNFTKNSHMNLERATILIGKELEETMEIIREFSRTFNDKLQTNKEIFEKIEKMQEIKDKFKELEESKSIQRDIANSVGILKEKIENLEKNKTHFEKEFKDYLESNEHKAIMEERKKINEDNKSLSEELLKLKYDLNLKELLKHFHGDEKKTKLLKRYSESFNETLKNDVNLELIFLLKDAEKNSEEARIKDLRTKLIEQIMEKEDKKLIELEQIINGITHEIVNEKEKFDDESDKISKFEEKQKIILDDIREKAKVIWPNTEVWF